MVGAITGVFRDVGRQGIVEQLHGPVHGAADDRLQLGAAAPGRSSGRSTAAAIIVLLVVILIVNAAAILLRNRYDRRW